MNTPNWRNRTLWTGDNLDIMRGMNSESVDLIYLDPPFNSNRDYAAPIGSEAAGAAFKDTWTLSDVDNAWHGEIADREPPVYDVVGAARTAHGKGMKAYLVMMAVRLLEMRRVLKSTGSLYLHCDPTASHYLKMLLDAVLGPGSFRNEIVWRRTSAKRGTRKLAAIHDVILFYAVSNTSTFNAVYGAHAHGYVAKFYRFKDEHGKFQADNLTAAGIRYGDSGEPWRDIDPTAKGRHWGSPSAFPAHVKRPKGWDSLASRQKLDYLDDAGLIYWPTKGTGMPRFKRYLSTSKGAAMTDMVLDVPPLAAKAKEKVGYPTQKPLKLLERIIATSSNEGDMVLDPFAGCATACVAAEGLHREWVGIDLSPLAAKLVKSRLRDYMGLYYDVHHRTDIPSRTDLGELPDAPSHALWQAGRHLCGLPGAVPVSQHDGGSRCAAVEGRLRSLRQPATAVRGLQLHEGRWVSGAVRGPAGGGGAAMKLRDQVPILQRIGVHDAGQRVSEDMRVVAVVVSPLQLFEVAVHMLHADLVERTDNGALEQAPYAFYVVGVHVSDDPFLGPVVDRLVARVVVSDAKVGLQLVRVDCLGFVGGVALDESVKGVLADVGDAFEPDHSVTLDCTRDPGLTLAGALANAAPATADQRLVNLDDSEQRGAGEAVVAHSLADAMAQVPGRAVGDPECGLELVSRDTLLGNTHEVDGDEPLAQRQVGIVHDRPGRDAELVRAAEAMPLVPVGNFAQVGIATAGAADPGRPAQVFQVGAAVLIRREAVNQRQQVQ